MSERAFKNVIRATRVAVAKVRRAVENTILTNEMRSHALNRWLDEPGAIKAAPTV